MKKCERCGHCCVVCNLIPVESWEPEIKELKAVLAIDYFDSKHLEKDDRFILKRKKIYWGEIGKEIFICYYFDLDKRLCSIYPNRPELCKKFNCTYAPIVNQQWQKLLRGEYAHCLWG